MLLVNLLYFHPFCASNYWRLTNEHLGKIKKKSGVFRVFSIKLIWNSSLFLFPLTDYFMGSCATDDQWWWCWICNDSVLDYISSSVHSQNSPFGFPRTQNASCHWLRIWHILVGLCFKSYGLLHCCTCKSSCPEQIVWILMYVYLSLNNVHGDFQPLILNFWKHNMHEGMAGIQVFSSVARFCCVCSSCGCKPWLSFAEIHIDIFSILPCTVNISFVSEWKTHSSLCCCETESAIHLNICS